MQAVDNVEDQGGRVGTLAMDEPYLGGQIEVEGETCGHSMEESAAATADFVRLVEGERPDLVIGDIEPYPHYSVAEMKDWIRELDANGVRPAFFHLDVDLVRVENEDQEVANDLEALEDFVTDRGISFGVIFTSRHTEDGSDRAYYESTLEWTRLVKNAIGRPEHVIIQSWKGPQPDGVHRIPSNLPEEGPTVYSHTRLIRKGLAVLGE